MGEKKTAIRLRLSLNSRIYLRFHNLIIPANSGTTQIDHLLVSPYGLFIVETKNITGWIFGSEGQPKWTQTLYRKKYSFQNPLRQTYRQKKVLSGFLSIDESVIHTAVFFAGDCKFKTPMPANVMRSGIGRYIKRFRNRVLSPEEMDRVVMTLQQHDSNSSLTARDHVRSLRARHASKTACPRCGSDLVKRTAKKGPNAGSKFLGCKNYPKCRFTKNA